MIQKLGMILICLLLLTGCQAQTELNKMGIVVAIAIDKENETGDILLTSQVIRPGALAKEGTRKEAAVEMITTKGKTLFEAIRNTTQIFDRINFYAHTKVIVINEELAKEGVTQFLDFLVRGKELRGYTWLCVARNTDAKEIIGVQEGIDSIQGIYLKDMIDNSRYHNKATAASVIDFYRKALKEGVNPITGVFQILDTENAPVEGKTSQKVKFSGTAVFIKDKLVGYLNDKETQGLNWILGEVQGAAIALPSLLDKEKFMSIEIKKLKSKIEPKVVKNEISFVIKIQVDASLVEEQGMKKLISPKEMLDYIERVEELAAQIIKEEVIVTMDKVQKTLKSDILGFGSTLNRKYPQQFNAVKDRWNEVIFPQVDYEVNVDVNIIGVDLKQGIFEIKE